MRFDVNLSMLWTDLPLTDRPRAAAVAGFEAVEMWWPFAGPTPPAREVDALVQALEDAGTRLVCLNFDGGDFARGERGLLSLPEVEARFRDAVDSGVALAGRLGCRTLNALYGNASPALDAARRDDIAAERLAMAAARASAIGATVVLEALNPREFPAYGLHTVEAAIALADRVRRDTGATIGCLFDLYNIQRGEGDLIARIEANALRIAHVQVADVPDRRRPGTGEIDYEHVLGALERVGYTGYVGLEYRPSEDPNDTFVWLPRERRAGDHPVGALNWR